MPVMLSLDGLFAKPVHWTLVFWVWYINRTKFLIIITIIVNIIIIIEFPVYPELTSNLYLPVILTVI